jgi:hypothetical protein
MEGSLPVKGKIAPLARFCSWLMADRHFAPAHGSWLMAHKNEEIHDFLIELMRELIRLPRESALFLSSAYPFSINQSRF